MLLEGKPVRAERRHSVCAYLFGGWWEGPAEGWPRGGDLYRTQFLNSMEFCLGPMEFGVQRCRSQQASGNLTNSGDSRASEKINECSQKKRGGELELGKRRKERRRSCTGGAAPKGLEVGTHTGAAGLACQQVTGVVQNLRE